MNEQDFVARYAGIYEHSPWVAERVAPFAMDVTATDRIAELMADCVDNADTEKQLALIRAHPDLAGKAQVAGKLTAESTEEQASAGLVKAEAAVAVSRRFQDAKCNVLVDLDRVVLFQDPIDGN